MLTIHRTFNTIVKLANRGFHQCSSSSKFTPPVLSATDICLSHIYDPTVYYRDPIPTIQSITNITFINMNPFVYKNYYFWIESLEDSYYAFGIKRRFMYEYGNIDYINIEEQPKKILSSGEYIGHVESDQTVYTLDAPFNNCIVVDDNNELSLDMLNNDPENINHHLCILEHVLE
jgi:glycine cleavage system H lipoate-binding protein